MTRRVRCWLGDLALLGTTPDIRTRIKPLRGLSRVGGWVKLNADDGFCLGDDAKVSRWCWMCLSSCIFVDKDSFSQGEHVRVWSEDAGLASR